MSTKSKLRRKQIRSEFFAEKTRREAIFAEMGQLLSKIDRGILQRGKPLQKK